ncbi:MAG: DUF559 domain-containing protein [Chloroflexi bacterium]|nr:DUF559 domain-containing protein [Chloroflexota bacterium]
MELQHIIWSWDTLVQRLVENQPDIGRSVYRSCRPIAAQRYRDGRLLLVLGCWWAADMENLRPEVSLARLSDALGSMLSERVSTLITRWPGGIAHALPSGAEEEQIPAPDVLQGLPEKAREEASRCESAIQRLFYARAYASGLRLRCQFPVLNYRLDFALPERRTGAEVLGWELRSRHPGAAERRDREEQLEHNGWQILMFSGSQVLSDVDGCVSKLARLAQSALEPGQQPLPTRYSPERSKPFSSLGTNRPADRGPRRPRPR